MLCESGRQRDPNRQIDIVWISSGADSQGVTELDKYHDMNKNDDAIL